MSRSRKLMELCCSFLRVNFTLVVCLLNSVSVYLKYPVILCFFNIGYSCLCSVYWMYTLASKDGMQMNDIHRYPQPNIRDDTRSKQQRVTKTHYKRKNQSNLAKHSRTGHTAKNRKEHDTPNTMSTQTNNHMTKELHMQNSDRNLHTCYRHTCTSEGHMHGN
jgi:hypothetical protein